MKLKSKNPIINGLIVDPIEIRDLRSAIEGLRMLGGSIERLNTIGALGGVVSIQETKATLRGLIRLLNDIEKGGE